MSIFLSMYLLLCPLLCLYPQYSLALFNTAYNYTSLCTTLPSLPSVTITVHSTRSVIPQSSVDCGQRVSPVAAHHGGGGVPHTAPRTPTPTPVPTHHTRTPPPHTPYPHRLHTGTQGDTGGMEGVKRGGKDEKGGGKRKDDGDGKNRGRSEKKKGKGGEKGKSYS